MAYLGGNDTCHQSISENGVVLNAKHPDAANPEYVKVHGRPGSRAPVTRHVPPRYSYSPTTPPALGRQDCRAFVGLPRSIFTAGANLRALQQATTYFPRLERNNLRTPSCSLVTGERSPFLSAALADDLLLPDDHEDHENLDDLRIMVREFGEFKVSARGGTSDSETSASASAVGSMMDSMRGPSKSSRNLLRRASAATDAEAALRVDDIVFVCR